VSRSELDRVAAGVLNTWVSIEADGAGWLVARQQGTEGALDEVSETGEVHLAGAVSLGFLPDDSGFVAAPRPDRVVLAAFSRGAPGVLWYSSRPTPGADAPWVQVAPDSALFLDPAGAGYAAGDQVHLDWQPLGDSFAPAGDPVALGGHPGLRAIYTARSDEGDVVVAVSAAEELQLSRISAAGELLERRTETASFGGISPLPGGGFAMVDFPDAAGGYSVRLRRAGPGLTLGEPVLAIPLLRPDEQIFALAGDDRVITRSRGAGLMLAGVSCD
jgi:hypothetical protein